MRKAYFPVWTIKRAQWNHMKRHLWFALCFQQKLSFVFVQAGESSVRAGNNTVSTGLMYKMEPECEKPRAVFLLVPWNGDGVILAATRKSLLEWDHLWWGVLMGPGWRICPPLWAWVPEGFRNPLVHNRRAELRQFKEKKWIVPRKTTQKGEWEGNSR